MYAGRYNVKVKQSYYRPGESLCFRGGWGSQIARQQAHNGSKVVTLHDGRHVYNLKIA
jgi:hypothetical protein